MKRLFLYLKNFDWALSAPIILLSLFGLIEIYSVALGRGAADFFNFKKQILFIVVGIVLLFVFAVIDFYSLKGLGRYLYFFAVFILVLVLLFGQTVNGTKGWFYIGGLGIQPVEFVKIILIIFLSHFFSSLATRVRPWQHLILSGITSFILIALVLLQPDFGSAAILAFIWLFMILLAGFQRKYFLVIAGLAVVLFIVSWFFFFKDYQKDRILTFINIKTKTEESYNVSQAMIAVGSGGIIGRGIGFGSQSQLKFLPEAQNDFLFAVISEELGFFGIFLVLACFAVFFWRALAALKKASNDFGIFIILGTMGLIFIQMFINIGMNIGLVPVVGLSLPFVSYGGSSMLASYILVGIIENIIIKSKVNY
ncbi:MAG: rod shape-determining protein RodA [Planctomycetes bacterium]|jgi:rod shape determining protein RodA|nr:rod shape-determining protein RodA [Planctomycetota bacterium]